MVYYTVNDFPDLIAIPEGAFADPGFRTPSFFVYESRKHGRVAVSERPDVVHMD